MQVEDIFNAAPEIYSPVDREIIERAYRIAEQAHSDQKRASGEPYFVHCFAVAKILAEMHVPPAVIAAGLLHDVVEDTAIELEGIEADFGEEIAKLVGAVTKLTSLPRVSRSDHADEIDGEEDGEREPFDQSGSHDDATLASVNLRKTLLAMADDPRVVLIKLADRLHNMRTLKFMPPHKRQRIAQETMDIFAPLASRLGIWQMKWELEDLSFRYINPGMYKEIASNLAVRRSEREKNVNAIIEQIEAILHQGGLKDFQVTGRPKHIYSIYRKMKRKGVPFDMVHDVRGVRIIVEKKADCYAALGEIHARWRPIPGAFDDYIAVPKENFYRSLHTDVVYDDGRTLEVQIRTREMHQNSEYGIAAHWRYKEGVDHDPDFEQRILYLRQLMEWRQDVDDAQEFVDGMKSDVFGDRVYVFTPKGDIIDLPQGATPIDFAYHIHTEVGHRCRGAKIGGKLVPLDYELQTGDQVEILTAKRGGPSRDWLNPHLSLIKTQRARAKVRRWFRRQAYDQNVKHGRELLERELRQLGLSDVNLENLARSLNFKKVSEMAAAIGRSDLPLTKIANELVLIEDEEDALKLPTRKEEEGERKPVDGINVRGLKGLLTRMAKCCNPAPGDDIVGYITRGRGATIHRKDCPNILNINDRERLVEASWGELENTFPVPVQIKAYDRDGLVRDVSTLLSEEGVNMNKAYVDVDHRNMAVFDLILEVRDIGHLSRILDRLERLPNIVDARRSRPG
jgi:GTP pyrophosphokinase